MPRWSILPLLASLLGCSFDTQPQTIPELRADALTARDEAEAARAELDAERAFEAADRAEADSTAATTLLDSLTEPTDEQRAAVEATQTAAREAREIARRADEEERLNDLLTGLKGKAYYGARGVSLQVVFKGLALAARQADERGIEDLPETAQVSARLAADVGHRLTNRPRLADGKPDWAGIADDLEGFSADPPQEIGLLVALSAFVLRQPGLALYEIENIDRDKLKTEDDEFNYVVLRILILAQHDMPLTVIDIIKAEEETTAEDAEQQLALIHLLAGYMYLRDSNYRAADLELVRAMRAWPDNPAVVFLTGEQLAASGKYEQAAESLEKLAAGTEHEWLAEKIADRARAVRDERGEAKPLLTDTRFVTEFVLHGVYHQARHSEAAAKAQESIETARAFGQRLFEQVPSFARSSE